jgi:hypothetical protein
MSDPAGTDEALREISRTMRQICLLHEMGRNDEAAQREFVALDPLIQTFRNLHGADALPDGQIRSLWAFERERAENSAALSELLVPLLLEQLRRPLDSLQSSLVHSPIIPASIVHRPTAASPEIADLLDGMLAQESDRPARRPHRPT